MFTETISNNVFQTPDLSNLTVFDFTREAVGERPKFSSVLPLARGGDYLTEFDIICAPVMNGDEVDYFVTGKLWGWDALYATILDANGVFHYTPVTALYECALLVAPVVVDETVVREYEEWVAYAISCEERLSA